MKNNKHILIVITVILAVAQIKSNIFSQNVFTSPYSMYGIGTLYSNSHQVISATGGNAIAIDNPYFINSQNPASYSAFDSNSFVIDVGFNLRKGTLSNINQSQNYTSGTISNISFGFPVAKWASASIGVVPFSNIGYTITDKNIVENIGLVQNIYVGDGGINKAYIGGSLQPFKYLSVGVNLNYHFGRIEKSTALSFPDSLDFINTVNSNTTRIGKLIPEFGAIIKIPFPENKFLQFGLTYIPKFTLNSTTEQLVYNYYSTSHDTIYYNSDSKKTIILPQSIGFGTAFTSQNQWFVTANALFQNWTQFNYLGEASNLKNSYTFSVGGQYRPSKIDIGKTFERAFYRVGARYQLGYLNVNNQRVNEFGISFGLGLPTRKSKSTINVALEFGSMGTKKDGLIKDNYIKFSIGADLVERWFIKPKYN